MNLRELYRLERGTELRLKGTDVIFELLDIDHGDKDRPAYIKVIEADAPVLLRADGHGDDIVLEVHKRMNNSGWIFNNKAQMRDNALMTRSEFEAFAKDFDYVVTLRDLEVNDHPISLADSLWLLIPETLEPLPVAKAREKLAEFADNKLIIKAINDSIESAAVYLDDMQDFDPEILQELQSKCFVPVIKGSVGLRDFDFEAIKEYFGIADIN